MFHCSANRPTFEILTSSAAESKGRDTRADTDGRQQRPSVSDVEILSTDIDGRCHQMRFLGSQCLRNALAAGLCCPGGPGPHWISLQRSSKSPSWTRGGRLATEKEKRQERGGEKVREGMGGDGQGWKGCEKKNLTLYSFVSLRAVSWQRHLCSCKTQNVHLIICINHIIRSSGRGAAGSRGSIDPPLFEVPGPPMQFDPPLLTQSKRAQYCENAVHRHKVKVY